MKMKTGTMTDKQQQAVAAMEAARKEGLSLSEFARAQGLAVRELYDALAALRRRGVLPRPGRRSPNKFVAVQVAPPVSTSVSSAPLCRIVHGGFVIECLHWPPASWIATLNAGTADAASRS
jgi:hypothetical protein